MPEEEKYKHSSNNNEGGHNVSSFGSENKYKNLENEFYSPEADELYNSSHNGVRNDNNFKKVNTLNDDKYKASTTNDAEKKISSTLLQSVGVPKPIADKAAKNSKNILSPSNNLKSKIINSKSSVIKPNTDNLEKKEYLSQKNASSKNSNSNHSLSNKIASNESINDKNGDSDTKKSNKSKENHNVKKQINKVIKFKSYIIKIIRHPLFLILGVACFVVALILIIPALGGEASNTSEDNTSGSSGVAGAACSYNINGYDYDNLQVELVNCDATKDNYKVLEQIPLEKYILGVALAEIGTVDEEALKAQLIAIRNFTLTRNESMCPGDSSNCFYGLNKNDGIIRMRACENDQVYWDYTKDIYRFNRGDVSLYSPEINSNTSGATIWKNALSQEVIDTYTNIAMEVVGKVMLDNSNNIPHVGFKSDTQNQFINLADNGKDYTEILKNVYGDNASTVRTFSCDHAVNDQTINLGDFQYWRQDDSKWANDKVGTCSKCTIGNQGCLATSITIQIANSKAQLSSELEGDLTPKTAIALMRKKGSFGEGGVLEDYSYAKYVAPNFIYNESLSRSEQFGVLLDAKRIKEGIK